MRVIYRPTMLSKINDAFREADEKCKKIDCIYLTKDEFTEFEIETNYSSGYNYPYRVIKYRGINILEEKE